MNNKKYAKKKNQTQKTPKKHQKNTKKQGKQNKTYTRYQGTRKEKGGRVCNISSYTPRTYQSTRDRIMTPSLQIRKFGEKIDHTAEFLFLRRTFIFLAGAWSKIPRHCTKLKRRSETESGAKCSPELTLLYIYMVFPLRP